MTRQSFLVWAVLLPLASSCGDPDPGPPGTLEIGTRTESDEFIPWVDSQAVPVVLGPNGLNMIVPSLRAYDLDPRHPLPKVEVTVGGLLMAADIKVAGSDANNMAELNDGGYALWALSVPFQTDLCCYNCSIGTLKASLTDGSGRQFLGEVSIQLARDTCPAPAVCCTDVNACPTPELTQLCE